jgi:2-polyprenyl-3-methyl-5-hydroxy-6-metoxy-1,4-benzoquinol methylase
LFSRKKFPYRYRPHRVEAGIRVFERETKYSKNYELIASDHLDSLKRTGENPFIEEKLWSQIEAPTKNIIKSISKPGQIVLDVGVGLGRIIGDMDELRRYGVDISFGYLNVAKSFGIECSFAFAEDLPYVNEAFDLVIATDVLEHVLDLQKVSQELFRVLKPGGYLLIRVPFEEDLSPYLTLETYEFVHLRSFSEAELILNFTKLLGLSHIGTWGSGPYLQGAARMRVRSISDDEIALIKELDKRESLGVIGKIAFSDAELCQDLYRLKSEYPDRFKAVEHLVVKDIEITALFQKNIPENMSAQMAHQIESSPLGSQ